MSFRRLLARFGYNDVDLADDGRIAVELATARGHAAAAAMEAWEAERACVGENKRVASSPCRIEVYDLILMDLSMPNCDGLQATREIRAALPEKLQPTIIALSANSMISDREACEQAGMDAFLTKPVRVEDLRKA